jgi:hypothetical protein
VAQRRVAGQSAARLGTVEADEKSGLYHIVTPTAEEIWQLLNESFNMSITG